jgi:hypothetical protein
LADDALSALRPDPVAVRRIAAYLWGEDIVNVRAAVESFANDWTVVPKEEAAALPAASPALDVERLAVAWIDLIERAMWALPWREYATERDLAVNIVRRLEELHGPEGGLPALARLVEQEAADR